MNRGKLLQYLDEWKHGFESSQPWTEGDREAYWEIYEIIKKYSELLHDLIRLMRDIKEEKKNKED